MSQAVEVLFMSDSTERSQTINCVDPHIGTNLISYKNSNGVAKRCLALLGSDYLISADVTKPILHVWQLNSEEPMSSMRMVVAGKVTALAVSNDGVYCAAGIDCKIYIWNTSSGFLLKVITRHYQPINKILFSEDGSLLVTCAEDGLVLVWKVVDVVAKETGETFQPASSVVSPMHVFSQHSLPITDMHLGHGSLKARLFTVSADQTCKIFSLVDGNLLVSLVFDYILTAVVTNDIETELFLGTNCGKIRFFNLDPYPRNLEHHVTDTSEDYHFLGHTKAVTLLALSIDGLLLASGSDDEKVILWNIPSRQSLRTFTMKAPVTGLLFHSSPRNIFEHEFKPRLVLRNFEKASPPERTTLEINLNVLSDLEPLKTSKEFDGPTKEVQRKEVPEDESEVADLKEQIRSLKDANKKLYQFAMREILKNPMAFQKSFTEDSSVNGVAEEI